jgi:hypothetical protein
MKAAIVAALCLAFTLRASGQTQEVQKVEELPPLKEQASSSETLPAVPIEKLVAPELRYRIVQEFGPIFFRDPDMHPVGHDDRPRAYRIPRNPKGR